MMMKMSASFLLAVLLSTCAVGGVPRASCHARCGEPFSRGQPCHCDLSCLAHDECCTDFEAVCTAAESCRGRCGEIFRRGRQCECDSDCARYNTCCHDYQLHCDAANCPRSSLFPEPLPAQDSPLTSDLFTLTASPAGPAQPILALSDAPSSQSGGFSALLSSPISSPPDSPVSGSLMPSQVAPLTVVSHSPDLCADTAINALTALANATLLVFRGDFFWAVDPQTRTSGPPRSISGELGIPGPIDSAFTRCNCQGSTYIIKGDQVWRLDNGVVEEGSPRSLSSVFSGLNGSISAALPIPATRRRPEAVYFFKKGGSSIQKLSFPPDSTSSCNKKPRTSSSSRIHPARETGGRLGAEVSLRVSLKGFPSPVSSALSLQNSKKSEGYEYYVFSGRELPALTKPDSSSALTPKKNQRPRAEQNPLRDWLQCA
ncbi:proteoglycan 4a [Aplochiton taeniatus]